MRIDGIELIQGSNITNLAVGSGTSFPADPDEGEMFFRTDSSALVKGLYVYIAGSWDRIASSESITAPASATLPASGNTGDLYYKNSNDGSEGLYVYNDSTWVAVAASGTSFTITGDVTGTIDGGTDVLTLATVNSNTGSFGNNSSYVQFTVNGKGLITAASTGQINIDAAQVVSGSFADARIPQSAVTQHQGALSISASQTTSGTFADARISQSSVTQHQAALTIAETQITDGALLARVGGNETISGNWTFNNSVVGAEPSTASHLATKQYVDNAVLGLTWKRPARVATTANITMSGTQTIDGVALSVGDRVLVKNQSTQAENGVWVVASSTWTRATDFDAISPIDEINSAAVFVSEGSTQSDTGWTQTSAVATVGVDAITFVQFSAAGAFTAGAGLSLTGNTFNIGTASSSRIVVNVDDIDLATVTDGGTGTFLKFTRDNYGRVSGTTAVTASDVTGLVDGTYVNITGDTMTGQLGISTSTDSNFSGINITNSSTGTSARAGVGANADTAAIQIGANSSTASSSIQFGNLNETFIRAGANAVGLYINVPNASGVIRFATGATERMRIGNDGRTVIGADAPMFSGLFEVAGLTSATAFSSVIRHSADTGGATQVFYKSRGTAHGSFTSVVSGDTLADISFQGADGTTNIVGAIMRAAADGTVSTGIVPTRLAFQTRNTSGSLNERMRISSSGNVLIGTTLDTGNTQLEVVRSSAAHIIARATSASGYASMRLYNDQNSSTRSLEIDYTGSTFGTALTGGPSGEQAVITTPGAYPIVFGTQNTLRLMLDAGGSVLVNRSSTSGLGALQVNGVTDIASANSSSGYGTGEQALYLRNSSATANARGAGIRFDWNNNTGGAAQIDLISIGTNGGALSFGTRTSGSGIAERMRINDAGNVVISSNGTTYSALSGSSLFVPYVQINGTVVNSSSLMVSRWNNDTTGSIIWGAHSRGTSLGSYTALQSGDNMLSLIANGSDGTQFIEAARIQLEVDGAVTTNNVPGRIIFLTNPTTGGPAAGTERMRIDSSGMVGIATSAPAVPLHVVDTVRIQRSGVTTQYGEFENTASGQFIISRSATGNAKPLVLDATTDVANTTPSAGTTNIVFRTLGTERCRIAQTGEFLHGTTATTGFGFKLLIDGTGTYVQSRRNAGGASTHIEFSNTNGVVGSITTNGTATAYNTSSDERLKDNIVDAPSAGEKLDAVKVRSFDWKADGSHTEHGFVAQELVEVVPEAVSVGDEDRHWAVDYAKLVPLLVKEIQELRARVAALEAE